MRDSMKDLVQSWHAQGVPVSISPGRSSLSIAIALRLRLLHDTAHTGNICTYGHIWYEKCDLYQLSQYPSFCVQIYKQTHHICWSQSGLHYQADNISSVDIPCRRTCTWVVAISTARCAWFSPALCHCQDICCAGRPVQGLVTRCHAVCEAFPWRCTQLSSCLAAEL